MINCARHALFIRTGENRIYAKLEIFFQFNHDFYDVPILMKSMLSKYISMPVYGVRLVEI